MKTVYVVIFVTESDNVGLAIEIKGVFADKQNAIEAQAELLKATKSSSDWSEFDFEENAENLEWYASDGFGTVACSIYEEEVK